MAAMSQIVQGAIHATLGGRTTLWHLRADTLTLVDRLHQVIYSSGFPLQRYELCLL